MSEQAELPPGTETVDVAALLEVTEQQRDAAHSRVAQLEVLLAKRQATIDALVVHGTNLEQQLAARDASLAELEQRVVKAEANREERRKIAAATRTPARPPRKPSKGPST